MITKLEDFKAHTLAVEVGEEVWSIVIKWGYFEKDTTGKQFVRSVDSIASNLSEGLGMYHYMEAKNFACYSGDSLFETRTWLEKTVNRGLIEKEQAFALDSKLDILGRIIDTYITSIGKANEPITPNFFRNDSTPNVQLPMP